MKQEVIGSILLLGFGLFLLAIGIALVSVGLSIIAGWYNDSCVSSSYSWSKE